MTAHNEMKADVIIIGGSFGGCSAALAALKSGKRVIMTEETAWIGGQVTNQGVPPDEHPWIENFGCTQSYRLFRNKVRHYYQSHFPVTTAARQQMRFNPGNAIVSNIAHEPRVSLQVIYEMLAPYINSAKLILLLEHSIISASTEQDRVQSVIVEDLRSGKHISLSGPFFVDATECGDVLPLAGVEYVVGAESRLETDEPHAVDGPAQPNNCQAITYCFAMDHMAGENHVIDKPEMYDFWREYKADFWPDKLLSWSGVVPHTLEPIKYSLFPDGKSFSLWLYRRVIDRSNFEANTYDSDITIVNWPQNDYWLGSIIDVSEEEREKHLYQAKQLSLSLLYWMQTEAPRPDGGKGYPGLRLRKDIMGTSDGLAMYPYIRESRRIKAVFTVLEQHVSADQDEKMEAARFEDSIGIGCYRIDLHPSTGQDTYIDISSYPFQIPLGSLIPIRVQNLIPASKNIGTTHITNGCYRLHPVEWNIGEAAGYLVSYCIDNGVYPKQVREDKGRLNTYQARLADAGIELEWPATHKV